MNRKWQENNINDEKESKLMLSSCKEEEEERLEKKVWALETLYYVQESRQQDIQTQ